MHQRFLFSEAMAPKRMLEKGTGSVCRYGTDRAAGRDRQGIYVHTRQERIGGNRCMDNLGMLKEVLRLVRKRKHGSTPVLVLDIRRSRSRRLWLFVFDSLGCGHGSVSTLPKIVSSDGSLAHAGTRKLSRAVLLECGCYVRTP